MTKGPVIVDQQAGDLAKIDGEISDAKARIKRLGAEYADAEEKLDDARWNATRKAMGTARSSLDALETKRAEILAGIYVEKVEPKQQVSAAPVQRRAWEIDEKVLKARVPEYPDIKRGSDADKDEAFFKEYDHSVNYWVAKIQDEFRQDGFHPDVKVGLDFMATMIGVQKANFLWLSGRCMSLETCLAEIENRPTLKYAGVWSASTTYVPGEIVSHGGSSWHSNIKSQGLQPGESNPASWTLMTKRGRDGKDARP
ncbi:hypothetical protein [Mesorhizobium wenxiniae]|uniref:Uncharacterized protein n=1 Tax=Mesorhizobium wenxiniae TaxID=2014805 RepID=A0A271K8Q3_9HYPH|nr:hypothetical protein [Mesorhizobium wenxiniae]PAP92153.1 hypothetical protein CIT31_29805 [Mesorhizobium wenxiniae]